VRRSDNSFGYHYNIDRGDANNGGFYYSGWSPSSEGEGSSLDEDGASDADDLVALSVDENAPASNV
jgi:hypothetical protein